MNLEPQFEEWIRKIDVLIKEHPLQIITWEATRRCNLKCIHCGSPAEVISLNEELTTSEVINAFTQIACDFDMSKFRHINITGGEPFLRKDLMEILKNLYRFPCYRNIDIQTNGIFIADNPRIIVELKNCGVTGLGISIDGLEDSHDSFRQIKGGFKKALLAAQIAVNEGYLVTVSVVAHSKNVDEIPRLFQFVKREVKPRVFRLMALDPIGRMSFDSEYLLSSEQLRKVIDFLKIEYRSSCLTYSDPLSTIVELGCGGWMGRDLEGTFRPFTFHCIAGINNLGILYDGKLGSCSNISREFIQGDLKKENIKEVWENRYQQYRNFEWKKTGDCYNCGEWDFCHGGPMHKRYSSGSYMNCLLKLICSNKD